VSSTENSSRPRGRPRRFDADEGVAIAQHLFHARGYDAVSVADVTQALGINPPSFYAAFGSKAGLYARALDRYTLTEALPLADILRPDRPVAECLAALLEVAARQYIANPDATGCLVVEGTRCTDPQAREAARSLQADAEAAIRTYIAGRHPKEAGRVADFVGTAMAGLSAKARNGLEPDRLLAIAHMAGRALMQELSGETA
jgi:TetR/AcrR family transcriptional regulator, repressor for divergent bdcA